MAGGIRTKEIATRYPCVSGIIAETTKTAGRKINLVALKKSLVQDSYKKFLK